MAHDPAVYRAHVDGSIQDEAWTTTLAMLEANNVDAAAKLFAATTLKGKVGFFLPCLWLYADGCRLSMTFTSCPATRSQSCAKPSSET